MNTPLILFLVGEACLSLYWLVNADVMFDEFFTFSLAKENPQYIISALQSGVDSHPPLHYFAIKLGLLLNSARVLVFLFYIGNLLLLHSISKLLSLDPIFIIGLSIMTTMKDMSLQCRPYVFLLFFTSATLLFYIKWKKHAKQRDAICCGLCGFFSFFSHYFGFLVLGGLLASEMWQSITTKKASHLMWWQIVFVVFCLLWAFPMMQALLHYRTVRRDLGPISVYTSFLQLGNLLPARFYVFLVCVAIVIQKSGLNFIILASLGTSFIAPFLGMTLNYRHFIFCCGPITLYFARGYPALKNFQWKILIIALAISFAQTMEWLEMEKHKKTQLSNFVANEVVVTDFLTLQYLQRHFPNNFFFAVYVDAIPLHVTLANHFQRSQLNLVPSKSLYHNYKNLVFVGRANSGDIRLLQTIYTTTNFTNFQLITDPLYGEVETYTHCYLLSKQ